MLYIHDKVHINNTLSFGVYDKLNSNFVSWYIMPKCWQLRPGLHLLIEAKNASEALCFCE